MTFDTSDYLEGKLSFDEFCGTGFVDEIDSFLGFRKSIMRETLKLKYFLARKHEQLRSCRFLFREKHKCIQRSSVYPRENTNVYRVRAFTHGKNTNEYRVRVLSHGKTQTAAKADSFLLKKARV